jgi:hypothetical protein
MWQAAFVTWILFDLPTARTVRDSTLRHTVMVEIFAYSLRGVAIYARIYAWVTKARPYWTSCVSETLFIPGKGTIFLAIMKLWALDVCFENNFQPLIKLNF